MVTAHELLLKLPPGVEKQTALEHLREVGTWSRKALETASR